jgi:hypothetical protein
MKKKKKIKDFIFNSHTVGVLGVVLLIVLFFTPIHLPIGIYLPILFFGLCPLMMFFMMKVMHSSEDNHGTIKH